ncbi:hypothetical protein GCM10020331_009060 [Ectobacillus funiculus]
MLLGDAGNHIQSENSYLHILRQKAAGMILLTAGIDVKLVEEIASEFPVVLACEYINGLHVPSVSIDNVSSARTATEHLISLGHTKKSAVYLVR